ncbi:MAG: response regulator [Pseudomonadota bacterium]|nr:response regulator [Pseudomonadota bacterium]
MPLPPQLPAQPSESLLSRLLALLLPLALPLGVLVMEQQMWELITPFGWLAFLPAVAVCGWLTGLRGGMLALLASVAGAEWLLSAQSLDGLPGAEARIYAALLFSVMALAVLLLLDAARIERERLHLAVRALAAAALGVEAPGSERAWRPWHRHASADLATIMATCQELEWRKACLSKLEVPLAVFAHDGRCLFANTAFLHAVRRSAEHVVGCNGLDAAHFPGTGLAFALRSLVQAPPPRPRVDLHIGGACELLLEWCGSETDGVVVCHAHAPPFAPGPAAQAAPPAGWPAAPETAPQSAGPLAAGRVASASLGGFGGGPRGIKGMRCLVVDDQAINRDLLCEILRLEGAAPVGCAGGREAVSAVSADPQAFDVVLMDLQMPGMDGYAAARAIRTLVDRVQLPILAITADGPGVPLTRLRDAGMQGLLHKPLDVPRMLALLAEAGGRSGSGAPRADSAPPQ